MVRTELDCWCEVLPMVPKHWRMKFVQFVESGETNDDFLAFLDQSPEARRACELILRADTATAKLMLQTLKK